MRSDTQTPTTLERPSSPVARAGAFLLSPNVQSSLIAGLAGLLLYRLTAMPQQRTNTYVWLADSLLHGRLDIPGAGPWLETVEWGGRNYSHQGLLPAVLMMPFVAIFKMGFDLRWFAALVGGACAASAWVLAGRIGLTGLKRGGACVLLAAGTTVFYEAKEASTWGVASITTVLFLLLSLVEYFGRRRPWVIGLMVGLAGLTRAPALLALLPMAWALRRRRPWELFYGALAPVIVMIAYNFARFGTIYDNSIAIHYARDGYKAQRPPGAFSPAHIPFNLYSWFLLVPAFQPGYPYLKPTLMGTGLPVTSPALFTALGARRERWLWVATGVVLVPGVLFYANGFTQFGMRYLLDAVPFLFALTCLALADARGPAFWPLLAYSVAFNTFGVFYTNEYGLPP